MPLKDILNKALGNLSVRCYWCNHKIKRKFAFMKSVKRLEFVYPKKTFFCNPSCCNNYIDYEANSPKKLSLCPSCPVPPGLTISYADNDKRFL